eukprot:264887_1
MWSKLAAFPSLSSFYNIPLSINNNEFLVIQETPSNSTNWYSIPDGIFAYHYKSQKWRKIINYSINFKSTYHSVAFCKTKNIICIQNEQQLLECDLNTKQLNVLSTKCNIPGHSAAIYAENKLHIVSSKGIHYIWSEKTKRFQQIYKFSAFSAGIRDHRLTYVKSQKSIYLFGGQNEFLVNKYNSIHKFSCIDNKWNKLSVKLPKPLCAFGITLIKNGKHILIFGGQTNKDLSNNIYIFNVYDYSFRTSYIQCPRSSYNYYAVNMYGKYYNPLLIIGFIKQFITSQSECIPKDIVNFIMDLVCNEIIHLMQAIMHVSTHWKISVDDILKMQIISTRRYNL